MPRKHRSDAIPPEHADTPALFEVPGVAWNATDHALLWSQWKDAAAESHKEGADLFALNRRMAELQHKMDAALARFKKAVAAAKRKGRVSHAKPVQHNAPRAMGFVD